MGTSTVVDELVANEDALRQAAIVGDTAALRRLKREKQDIERRAGYAAVNAQAKMSSRRRIQIDAPQKGEEKRLRESEMDLSAKINRLHAIRENDLVALAQQPDNDSLIAKLESCDGKISSAQLQLEAVHARQARIAEWHEAQQREARQEQEAQDRKSRIAEQRQLERKASSLADTVISNWTQLLSGLAALDEVEVQLKRLSGMKNHCSKVQDARMAIAKGTHHAIRYEDGGRHPDKYVLNMVQEVKGAK